MYVIDRNTYATPIAGTANYAVYLRDGGGHARRVGTIKRGGPGVTFTYHPSNSKRHGEAFDTLTACLASLKSD
jgi:hypothetical protein